MGDATDNLVWLAHLMEEVLVLLMPASQDGSILHVTMIMYIKKILNVMLAFAVRSAGFI